ncbi:MAG: hypothetical protein U5J63_05255 [Fodinibius sp.]|nr:hypothetical protein [Fodinibius sp.]
MYKVGISKKLMNLRDEITRNLNQ